MTDEYQQPSSVTPTARLSETALRVLLVEDHRDIAANICESFELAGHVMDYAQNAEQAQMLLKSSRFDVLILDIMLPGINGIELCAKIRQQKLSTAPILMLTARDQVEDKLLSFESGADDYLIKPFSTRELLARAAVLTRRHRTQDTSSLSVGPLDLNLASREVTRSGQSIILTKTGFKILAELMRVSPNIVLRDDLEHALWGDDRPHSDSLRTHISVLRTAVDKPFNHSLLRTVHGAGWKIHP